MNMIFCFSGLTARLRLIRVYARRRLPQIITSFAYRRLRRFGIRLTAYATNRGGSILLTCGVFFQSRLGGASQSVPIHALFDREEINGASMKGAIRMFPANFTLLHGHSRIATGLLCVLWLFITSLFFATTSSGAPLPQNTPVATLAATISGTIPVTPTVSVRCGRCIAWPTSDIRLDIASGSQADLVPEFFNSLKDIPIVRQFGVADNASLTKTQSGYQLRYNWSYGPQDCKGSHDVLLSITQTTFITSYNPTFFDSTVLDSATQYRRFLPFFQVHNPNTLIGYYYSAMSCLEDPTSPYMENYYPLNAVDCHRLVHPISPSTPISLTMKTQRWGNQCMSTLPGLSLPARLYVNVGDPEIRTRFHDNLIQTVKAIKPTPPFVFLDNVEYMEPEFAWSKGGKPEDCRERAKAGHAACVAYHRDLAQQFGPTLYFDDFIEHYRTLIASLEQEGSRSVLNVGMAAAVLGYARDEHEFAQQFEQAVGKNGINFEAPFAIAFRTNAGDTEKDQASPALVETRQARNLRRSNTRSGD
jgi:hypothetical protein